jgi:hypothetical protein
LEIGQIIAYINYQASYLLIFPLALRIGMCKLMLGQYPKQNKTFEVNAINQLIRLFNKLLDTIPWQEN